MENNRIETDGLPEMARRLAGTPACEHALTHDNCNSGSWAYDPVARFIPSPRACASCGRHDCDDCAESDVICQGCGEAICEGCTPNSRQRMIFGGRTTRREFLCAPCAITHDAALAALESVIYGTVRSEVARLLARMDRIAKDAERAIAEVSAQYDPRTAPGTSYAMQAGAFRGRLQYIASAARLAAEQSTVMAAASAQSFADRDSWLDDVVARLEEAIAEAKDAL